MPFGDVTEQDLDKDDYIPEPFKQASPEEVHQLNNKFNEERRRKEKGKTRRLWEHGFEIEHSGEILF